MSTGENDMIRRTSGVVVAIVVVMAASGPGSESRAAFEIRTLSSRADLVSGGDTLIAVKVPPGTRARSADRDA